MRKLSLKSIEKKFGFLRRSSLVADYFCPRIVYPKETVANLGYFGQYGQDIALEGFINLLPKKLKYTFVEIGAHDGITFSNSKFLESKEGWSGICIEANPSVYERLVKNRPNSKCLNVAVSDVDGEAKFLLNTGHTEMLSGLVTDYSKKHMKRIDRELARYGGTSNTLVIPSLRLETIILEHQLFEIDVLMIDVEGAEFSILKAIDFNRVIVNSILVERNYSSRPIYQFLNQHGYSRLVSLGGDDLYFRNECLRPSGE
jgi:FkbM family methyltransferase